MAFICHETLRDSKKNEFMHTCMMKSLLVIILFWDTCSQSVVLRCLEPFNQIRSFLKKMCLPCSTPKKAH